MLGNIYYFFGLLFFLLDLGLLMKFHRIQKIKSWIESFQKVTQKKPKKEDMNSEDYKIVNAYESIILFNFLWIFFGLVTKNWKLFLTVLIFNFFINLILNSVKSYRIVFYLFESLKFCVILSTIGFSVINHFHLHIDIFDLIFK